MSLDTKQKQGSALDIGMPFRQWLAEPVAVLTSAEHLSLLKLCSEPTPGQIQPTTVFLQAFVYGPDSTVTLRG